jgi:endonuclease/exonuclease/phosphatase family metal-dependent hydrolase
LDGKLGADVSTQRFCFDGPLYLRDYCAAMHEKDGHSAVIMSILTLNLRRESEEDGVNNWPHRRGLVAQLIKDVAPHLFGTQEGRKPQVYSLLNNLEEYGLADEHRSWDPQRFYPSIFFRQDSIKILESGDRWLSDTPEVHASKSWGSAYPRLATWALCRPKGYRTEFFFVCTHMDHISSEARYGQAGALVELLTQKNPSSLPVILVGDFNDVPGSAPYRTLTRCLKDVWLEGPSHDAGEGTWHGFSGKAQKGRLDWILVSPEVVARDTQIVRTSFEGRYPSDHFPVKALIEVPSSEKGQEEQSRSGRRPSTR